MRQYEGCIRGLYSTRAATRIDIRGSLWGVDIKAGNRADIRRWGGAHWLAIKRVLGFLGFVEKHRCDLPHETTASSAPNNSLQTWTTYDRFDHIVTPTPAIESCEGVGTCGGVGEWWRVGEWKSGCGVRGVWGLRILVVSVIYVEIMLLQIDRWRHVLRSNRRNLEAR